MAVTNGWGQGVINNTNGWGKLATNNIGAGSVYENSASGDTVLVAPSAPSFASTRSFNFDGVDNYMTAEIPVDAFKVATIRSFSFWVKINTLNTFTPLFSDTSNSGSLFRRSNGFGVQSGRLRWALESLNVSNAVYIDTEKVDGTGTAPNIGDGNWHHVAVYNSVDSHTNKANIVNSKIYLDGNKLTNFTVNDGSASVRGMTGGNIAFGGGNTNGFSAQVYLDGLIDEFAYFTNYELTDSDVTAIYGTGVPNNLNDLSTPPTAWYRMGENANYKSPQWLMPENSNKDKFSNYSFEFDGVDDFIDVGNPTELQITGALSISAWVKFTGNTAPIVSKYESGSASRPKSFGLEGDRSGSNHSPKFFIFNSGTIYETPASVKVVDDGNWHHLLAVFNPSTYLRLYIDGNLEQENTTSIPATIDNDAADFSIGAIKSVGNPITFFSGNIDEVAVWNSDQSSNVASIYNSGVPNDITSLNPVAWYRMGEQATWDGSKWTLIDQGTGSNNAESVNMTESDRQTDVPT